MLLLFCYYSIQVTVVHISATSKNAADDKLKQCMKRFVDTHGAPSTLLLISGNYLLYIWSKYTMSVFQQVYKKNVEGHVVV